MAIGFDIADSVVTITIAGENDLNPMTHDMYVELNQRLIQFDEDPKLRVALLRGAGDRAFSVGGNLKRYQRGTSPLSTEDRLRGFWYPRGYGLPGRSLVFERRTIKPVVGMIRGYCLGAAMGIMGLHTSLRVAAEGTKFGFAEVKRGLGGGGIVKSGLSGQLPRAPLMWMLLTGEYVDAAHAQRIGLINEVVPDDRLLARVTEIALRVAALPPLTLRAEHEVLLRTQGMPFSSAVESALVVETLNRLSSDAHQGVATLGQERAPGSSELA